MKTLIALSLFALSCTLFSCTADAVPSANTNAHAEDIGGQNGQIPVPPPPPTKP
ncbi:MAG TPA: hypothetical protein VK528_07175 [Flavobacterium sp.]|nr:hypothetical protein [Flavobacterium sp.]